MATTLELRCMPPQAAQALSSSSQGELPRAPAMAPDGELSRSPCGTCGRLDGHDHSGSARLPPFPSRPCPSSREHAVARQPFSSPVGTNCLGRWVPALRNTAGVAVVLQQGSLISPLRINSICRCRCDADAKFCWNWSYGRVWQSSNSKKTTPELQIHAIPPWSSSTVDLRFCKTLVQLHIFNHPYAIYGPRVKII
jgi:hypothetical protein